VTEYETTNQAGERLGLSGIRVRELCQQNRFKPPAIKIANRWLVPKKAKVVGIPQEQAEELRARWRKRWHERKAATP